MSSADTARDVAVLWTLDFDAELPCEALHHSGIVCSGPAVYASETCKSSKVICASAAKYQKDAINGGLFRCADCGMLCSECWSIRPI